VKKIFFADSVCKTWAEGYADALHEQNRSLAGFMEMRVHADEAFFAKLARAGITEMQLGVEALSEQLLKAMRKGTTVWQNLRAVKYLAELGIESASNLITHHPKSTLNDVEAARSILQKIPHFPGFSLSYFVVSYASPLYLELDQQDQESLPRGFDWLPDPLRRVTTNRDLAYPYPRAWLPQPAREAWDEFLAWHAGYEVERKRLDLRLTVLLEDGARTVIERRTSNGASELVLTGRPAEVLSHCHAAPKLADLATRLSIDKLEMEDTITCLEEDGLVIRLGERALSLPFRARETLIARIEDRRSSAASARIIALKPA
jgi:magnesium-protoporphyrin IX monomethyl ester (oxidative) cyclase